MNIVGGGGADTFTSRGSEILYFLHRLVQTTHTRRLQGDYTIPTIEVDHHMEERIRAILSESETANDWWIHDIESDVGPIVSIGPPSGAPLGTPVEGVHSCPSDNHTGSTAGSMRNSRAVRLSRLSELTRIQAHQHSSSSGR